MNLKSHLCNYIKENPTNWEEKLVEEFELRIRREDNLAIFNYAIMADFSNPIVQEARGIIIDVETLEVVCWPFRKFGNYSEYYADEIDWKSAKVLEKVDGSIIKLWYDEKNEKWQFSTNKTIRAENATVEYYEFLSYLDVIKKAENFKDIPFDELDKNVTYIFELVSPETRVVIRYPKTMLYHIGTRNNLTGEEFVCDIGIQKPKEYPLGSLEDCIKSASELNKNDSTDEITNEGFVVVDKNWNRVKIKSLDYVALHHLSTMQELSKKTCLELLIINPEKITSIIKERPQLRPAIKYYEYKLAELCNSAEQMVKFTRNLYAEYSFDRKAVAMVIKKHPLSGIGFKCLDCNKTGEELLFAMRLENLCDMIEDYTPVDVVSSLTKK